MCNEYDVCAQAMRRTAWVLQCPQKRMRDAVRTVSKLDKEAMQGAGKMADRQASSGGCLRQTGCVRKTAADVLQI